MAANGMELIYAECLRMPSRWIVRIFLDREGGITLDDCSVISHQAGDILDVHDTPPGPYTLEVSSPGWTGPCIATRISQIPRLHDQAENGPEDRRHETFQGETFGLPGRGR